MRRLLPLYCLLSLSSITAGVGAIVGGCTFDPEDAAYRKAHTYWERQDYTRAVDAYEGFARRYPKSSRAPTSLLKAAVISCYYLQDPYRAIELNELLVSEYPDSRSALEAKWNVARLYEEVGDYAKAIKYYSGLLEKQDLSPSQRCECRYKVARCYFLQGDLDNALVMYNKAVVEGATCENIDKAAYHVGYVRYLKGDIKGARQSLQEFLGRFPDSSWKCDAMIYLARCYERLNEPAKAKATYRKIADQCPDRVIDKGRAEPSRDTKTKRKGVRSERPRSKKRSR